MAFDDEDDSSADAGGEKTPIELEDNLSPAEQHFTIKSYSPKILFVMSIGLKDAAGNELVDLEQPPWSNQKKKDIKPNLKDQSEEILRRSAADLKPPKCSNWKAHVCTQWLKDHPVTGEADVKFLRERCLLFNTTALAAAAEQRAMTDGAWRGDIPHLRLILCLIEDDIKPKFLKRDKALSRLDIDARNSDTRKPTVYELIADRWNSVTFNPVLEASVVHENYAQSTDCSHNIVAGLTKATASKVRDLISSMRADLVRMITNWELSGQGDGSIPAGSDDGYDTAGEDERALEPDHPVFGKLGGRAPAALDSRASFLRGSASYLLILWELTDEHQLLSSTLQRLNDSVSAGDASSAPSVIKMRRPNRPSPTFSDTTDGNGNDFSKTLGKYNVDCALRNVSDRLSALADKKSNFRVMKFRATSTEEREFVQEEIDSIDAEIEVRQKERRGLERNKAAFLD
jgi:hypothetical protein